MDLQLNDDQRALVEAVQSIVADHSDIPQSARTAYCHYDESLRTVLDESGFLDAARSMGSLEAALVAIEVARSPVVAEVAASALVLPQLCDETVGGPVSLVSAADFGRAVRNLPVAHIALVDCGEDALLLDVSPDEVTPAPSILAYPYGRFPAASATDAGRRLAGAGATLRQWWRVAIACEMAGAAQSAVDFTVDYVKTRRAFGRPIGSFQALQHRLAHCHRIVQGMHYLALRAAWSGESVDADQAACYAMQNIQRLLFDLHQFNGAMGVTNEHLLHFWTYRLRALQAETGGQYATALEIARKRWGEPAPAEVTPVA